MKQAVKQEFKTKKTVKSTYKVRKPHKKRAHKAYGTSKLETLFAHDFLDKLGIKYVYQYEMDGIGRFLDFVVVHTLSDDCIMEEKDGINCVSRDKQTTWAKVAIEIDGGYYHSDPRVVNEEKLNPMQKHNKKVDEAKNKWCEMHHLPLLRIWEYDIHNNPKMVIDELKKYIKLGDKQQKINDLKKIPH